MVSTSHFFNHFSFFSLNPIVIYLHSDACKILYARSSSHTYFYIHVHVMCNKKKSIVNVSITFQVSIVSLSFHAHSSSPRMFFSVIFVAARAVHLVFFAYIGVWNQNQMSHSYKLYRFLLVDDQSIFN